MPGFTAAPLILNLSAPFDRFGTGRVTRPRVESGSSIQTDTVFVAALATVERLWVGLALVMVSIRSSSRVERSCRAADAATTSDRPTRSRAELPVMVGNASI